MKFVIIGLAGALAFSSSVAMSADAINLPVNTTNVYPITAGQKTELERMCRSAKPLTGFQQFWLAIKIKVDVATNNQFARNRHLVQQHDDILASWCEGARPWFANSN